MKEPSLVLRYIGGQCPVQAEGEINGVPFYFRARGQHWSLSVGKANVWEEWELICKFSDEPFDAGYMDEEVALGFIHKAAKLYQLYVSL